jgi:hypothetical protein
MLAVKDTMKPSYGRPFFAFAQIKATHAPFGNGATL